jgi:hypothetical protein
MNKGCVGESTHQHIEKIKKDLTEEKKKQRNDENLKERNQTNHALPTNRARLVRSPSWRDSK